MRYLLVDHITEWKSDSLIRGVKNVAMSEDFLEFHFPGNPIMPGVMLLEALTQLTGWLEAASSDFQNWFLISSVLKSNFYGFALPGDQVEMEVEAIRQDPSGTKIFRGSGFVKGKKKIIAEYQGTCVPLDEIEDPESQKRFFTILTRTARRK